MYSNRRACVVTAPVLLQRFGLDRSLASPDLVSFSHSQYMTLDAVTLRDLEVCSVRRLGADVLIPGQRLMEVREV